MDLVIQVPTCVSKWSNVISFFRHHIVYMDWIECVWIGWSVFGLDGVYFDWI